MKPGCVGFCVCVCVCLSLCMYVCVCLRPFFLFFFFFFLFSFLFSFIYLFFFGFFLTRNRHGKAQQQRESTKHTNIITSAQADWPMSRASRLPQALGVRAALSTPWQRAAASSSGSPSAPYS